MATRIDLSYDDTRPLYNMVYSAVLLQFEFRFNLVDSILICVGSSHPHNGNI